jgi:hypothetical protein
MCIFKRKIKNMDRDDALWWIDYDIELHMGWLKKPESAKTGTWEYHRKWVGYLQEVRHWLKGELSTMTRPQIIAILYEAQATHTEDAERYPVGSDEYKWNYDWWYVYDGIMGLIPEAV